MRYHYVWLLWSLGFRAVGVLFVDIESFIFAFAVGGIGMILYA